MMITKRWLVAMLFLFSAPIVCASSDLVPFVGPKALLLESVYKFRPVVEGQEVVHEFILQNQGDEPLDILKIDSG